MVKFSSTQTEPRGILTFRGISLSLLHKADQTFPRFTGALTSFHGVHNALTNFLTSLFSLISAATRISWTVVSIVFEVFIEFSPLLTFFHVSSHFTYIVIIFKAQHLIIGCNYRSFFLRNENVIVFSPYS